VIARHGEEIACRRRQSWGLRAHRSSRWWRHPDH
jgi:hypothetical protein